MGNILNHNRLPFEVNLNMSDYWDFALYLPQCGGVVEDGGIHTRCLAAYINTDIEECLRPNGVQAVDEYKYSECVSKGIELRNIGFTGMDNGYILFDKYTITPDEFAELLTKSIYSISADDCVLKLFNVNGNNKIYDYTQELTKEDGVTCLRLNGGFLQGIFRYDDGCSFKILPDKLTEAGWGLEFELKRKDFINTETTLNTVYPENKGIFFYMGTRAENKWIKYYDSTCEFPKNENLPDTTVESDVMTTNDGHLLDEANLTEIETENKYILFDRSCKGLTTETYQEGDTAVIQYKDFQEKENYFTLFNRSCDGLTVLDYDKYLEENSNEYNVYNDLYKNAFTLQVRDDGSVGYKYLLKDCEAENPDCSYKIESEFSNRDVVPYNEWVNIHVRIIKLKDGELMRLMFYVNGKLKLVSKELPTFDFRNLKDLPDKQEGVPFNISLGGGTQGLCDVIYNDYLSLPQYQYPIEKEFAGTFVGFFKSFKFYECALNFNEIMKNNSFKTENRMYTYFYGYIEFNNQAIYDDIITSSSQLFDPTDPNYLHLETGICNNDGVTKISRMVSTKEKPAMILVLPEYFANIIGTDNNIFAPVNVNEKWKEQTHVYDDGVRRPLPIECVINGISETYHAYILHALNPVLYNNIVFQKRNI